MIQENRIIFKNFFEENKRNLLNSVAGIIAWGMISFTNYFFSIVFKTKFDFSFFHFILMANLIIFSSFFVVLISFLYN